MNLEKGNKNYPTGNVILYCNVVGQNPLQPGDRIIATNVVVSFLRTGDNLPVVTFPPVSMPNWDNLKAVLSENPELYDVIRLPDFELPENSEQENQYIQERMDQFNQVVIRYVELCKNRDKRQNPKEEPVDSVKSYLDALTKLSLDVRTSKGLAREATLVRVDKLVNQFTSQFPQMDAENFKKAIQVPGELGDELVGLYIRKFGAISTEDYEIAQKFQNRIREIESLSS